MNFKEKMDKFKKTERGKSFIKFGWDMLFILFVFILILSSGTLNNKQDNTKEESTIESKEEISYVDMQKVLIDGKYEFEYKITGILTVNYTGSYNNGEVVGFRESDDSLIKYHIKDDVIYKNKMGTEEEYSDLYTGLDENLFNLEMLFNTLNGSNVIKNSKEDNKIYTYEEVKGYEVEVSLDDTHINRVIIKNNDLTYEFSFTYWEIVI